MGTIGATNETYYCRFNHESSRGKLRAHEDIADRSRVYVMHGKCATPNKTVTGKWCKSTELHLRNDEEFVQVIFKATDGYWKWSQFELKHGSYVRLSDDGGYVCRVNS